MEHRAAANSACGPASRASGCVVQGEPCRSEKVVADILLGRVALNCQDEKLALAFVSWSVSQCRFGYLVSSRGGTEYVPQ